MLTPSRQPVKDFLQFGRFEQTKESSKRKLPPDHTILEWKYLPEMTRMPSFRMEPDYLPKGNQRPRFLNRNKIKVRRSRYWDLAIKDFWDRNESGCKRVMQAGWLLRQGWTPAGLRAAGCGEGVYWRTMHMHYRMR